MPKLLFSLPFCLLLAGAAAAAAENPAAPGEIRIFAGRHGYDFNQFSIFTGTAEPVVLLIHSTSVPPAHLTGTERSGSELRLYLEVPAATASVPAYDYVLTADLPPAPEEGHYQVAVYAFFDNAQPPGEKIASLEVAAGAAQTKILGIRPERPTAKDRIEVLLDHRPCEPATSLLPQILSKSVRLRSDNCWRAAPEGYSLFLEPLPPGRWALELEAAEAGIESRLDFEILPSATVLAGSFDVAVAWRTAAGEEGEGQLVQAPSADSALFYFFSPANWELMVKVLDGCALNGHYWVFTAASTTVAFEVLIDRHNSHQQLRLENPLGVAAPAVTNVEAFPCDPALPLP